MVYESLYDAVANLGFPIFVAIFMLVRVDKVQKENAKVLSSLNDTLKRIEIKLS
jgi:hypothetical protein